MGDESRFLEEPLEDRSPTPESQPQDSEDHSLPSSPSPPPDYTGADGNTYSEGTLSLMATAPSHLRKSSDDLVLEEFFGTEQLTKLDMFKKQLSSDTLPDESRGVLSSESLPQIVEEGLRPGVSMPNISNPSSSSSLSYPNAVQDNGQVRLRLAKNRLSDANRMSYDVAYEMEKLRARLQETAKQELAEFDRKYSPKLHHHPNVMAMESGNNHFRQGSLDSSIPQQHVATPPLEAVKSYGHSRQHSLPIDPKFLRQLQQQNQANETTPTLATHKSGWSPSLGNRVTVPDQVQSPTPPLLFGHVRQVSGGSMSSEGGTFSPPLTPNQPPSDSHAQNLSPFAAGRAPARSGGNGGGVGLPYKLSNPPGMARIASDGGPSLYNRGSSNSLSRASPEGDGRIRSSSNTQPHYSTAVIKRGGKRGSLEITTPPSMPHPQHGGAGLYKYEEKASNGRPSAYEQPKRRSYGEDIMETDRNFHRLGNGSVGRYTQVSPPRMEGNIPASPKMSRVPERRGGDSRQQQPPAMSKLQTRASDPAVVVNYTPFSQHQQRSYTVSAADAPKLAKQPKLPTSAKSAKNTWI